MYNRLPFCLLILLSLSFQLPVLGAEELLLGEVETINSKWATAVVAPAERVNLRPAEKVVFKTPVPGLDEMAESSVGYVRLREDGKITVRFDGGEDGKGGPQVHDKAFLIRGTYANDKRGDWTPLSVAEYNEDIENWWGGLDEQDISAGIEEGFVGAQCGKASNLGTRQGATRAMKLEALELYKEASEKWELTPYCARGYAKILKELQHSDTEKWAKYATKSGSSIDIFFYADLLTEKKDYDSAKTVLHKFLGTNPRSSKYGAESRLKDIEQKQNGYVAENKSKTSLPGCKNMTPLQCADAQLKAYEASRQ